MENLVKIENGWTVTDSRQVAEHFGKRHKDVLRDIEVLKADVPNFGEMFMESTLPDSYGREQKMYYMNCDGFILLVRGFTGKKVKVLELQIKFIQAFNDMEEKKRVGKIQLNKSPYEVRTNAKCIG